MDNELRKGSYTAKLHKRSATVHIDGYCITKGVDPKPLAWVYSDSTIKTLENTYSWDSWNDFTELVAKCTWEFTYNQ